MNNIGNTKNIDISNDNDKAIIRMIIIIMAIMIIIIITMVTVSQNN